MVHVEVDDHDALQPVFELGQPGRDRHVVEQAKPHGAVAGGVMPRRAHRCQRVVRAAGDDFGHRAGHRPRRQLGDLERTRGEVSIGVDQHRLAERLGLFEQVEVFPAVDLEDELRARRFGFARPELGEQIVLCQSLPHPPDPPGVLDVAFEVVLYEARVGEVGGDVLCARQCASPLCGTRVRSMV